MKKILLPLICIAMIVQSCDLFGGKDSNERPKTLPRSLTSSEEALITSGNTFSFNIFQKIVADEQEKNVFISPLSISMALGMTLNGAGGETKAGIKQTLGMSEMDLQAINRSYQSFITLLSELDSKVEMDIGNSVWGGKGFSINQSFKDTLKTYFDARADELDFSKPSAVDVINGWVNDQTKGRIEKIMDGSIPSDIVLYLINTVYFKGNWLAQFDSDDTKPEDFYLEDGSIVQVDMMSRGELSLAEFRSDKVEMAEIAFGDSLYQMMILMPADTLTPIDKFVQRSLTASNLETWIDQLKPREMILKLPKFESSYKKKLNDILADMGMEEAFSESHADFSNINPDVALFISEVIHKANISVNEEGSEAAAVTSVGFGTTSASGPPAFIVNRPFVYLIRERISGTLLFAGMMKNPGR